MKLNNITLSKLNNSKKMKTLRANFLLLVAAVIWGSAFVAQDNAGRILGSFSINFSRYLIGAIALIPLYFVMDHYDLEKDKQKKKATVKNSFIGGIFCGFALFAASVLQQFGINCGADPGKAGFITVMYIVIVPLFGLIFKKRVGIFCWIAVTIAPFGLYFLCMKGFMMPEFSDILLLLCALVFSVHILVIDHFSPKANGVLMSCVQFFTVSLISLICTLIFEAEMIKLIPQAIKDIVYLGVMSSGVAYTLQIIGQKNTSPTVASLIMSLESVFAMIFGALVVMEIPEGRKIFGAAIIFTAVILAQLPQPKKFMIKRR
ncbi:MAG: DMT family transporter [Clostridia bacterium]|nr:DMT family transporter [Clostridia bacterium]